MFFLHQEWILSKNLVLLYSFDLYDAWSKSMRFIPQLLNYFKVSDFI
jgi:hypothetical protein